MDYGQEEAAAVQGEDPRQYLVSASKFEGDANGNVTAVHVHDIEWVSENGRFMPKKVEASERVLKADLVAFSHGIPWPRKYHCRRTRTRSRPGALTSKPNTEISKPP